MRHFFQLLLFPAILFAVTATAIAQPEFPELSKLEGGRRILDYFKAFNANDEQVLKRFFEENLTAEALAQRPVGPRLEFHRQIREDHRTLTIKEVASVEIKNDVTAVLVVRGATGGWISYTFRFERQSPQKLLGWQIEMTDEPAERDAAGAGPSSRNELPAATAKFMDGLVAEDRFSGVVLIAKGSVPVFQKAFGWADREAKRPNDTETAFNLGSINKIFTRIAIGQLVAAGKISFDDKLGKLVPDYPNKEAREKVTVRHLVTMTSGIGDIFGPKFESTPKQKLRSIKDFIPLFADQPLAFEPGTQNRYSNGGYVLLGAIIENVSGMSYYDYVRRNIFDRAGMSRTDSYESDAKTANLAQGYTTFGVAAGSKDVQRNNLDTRPARGSSAGGGYSTVGDMLRFSLALQSGKLRIPDDDGKLGDASARFGGIGIAGGSPGVNGVFEVTENGYTIVVLSNYDPPSAERVASRLAGWVKRLKD